MVLLPILQKVQKEGGYTRVKLIVKDLEYCLRFAKILEMTHKEQGFDVVWPRSTNHTKKTNRDRRSKPWHEFEGWFQ